MTRHVRDLHLGLSPLGDVLVRGDPAAARHGLAHDGNGAAVIQLDKRFAWLSGLSRSTDIGDKVVGINIAAERADGFPPFDNIGATCRPA